MKKFYFLFSAVLGLTACHTEDLLPVDRAVSPESMEGNVTFTLNVPENDVFASTRSALFGPKSNSANGGLTNVNFDHYDLRYKLAIYRVEAGSDVVAISPITKTFDAYQGTTYSLSLTPNRRYKVVVWADFVNEDTKDDLHYNTADFKNITVLDASTVNVLNDESRDAYRVVKEFELNDTPVSENLVLTRPFAKVRFVATDWGLSTLEKPTNVKVTYYGCDRFSGLNLLTGETQKTTLADKTDTSLPVYTGTIDRDTKEYALGYDGDAPNNRTLFVDYLMTKNQSETPIHLTIEALDGTKSLAKHDVQTNVPIKTNWLTTILGRALTKEATFTVSVEEYFVNNWIVNERWWREQNLTVKAPRYDATTKTYYVGTREEFAWLSDNTAEVSTDGDRTIVLTNDIDMSGVEWKPIHDLNANFDGKCHKLRNFSINGKYANTAAKLYLGVFGAYNGKMRSVTFENITIHGLSDSEQSVKTGQEAHNEHQAYFAGCIAYSKADKLVVDNVHGRHIHIKASTGKGTQNIGGLFGGLGAGGGTAFRGCSVKDVHVQCNETSISPITNQAINGSIGGFAGYVMGGKYISFDHCVIDQFTLRIVEGDGATLMSPFVGTLENGDNVSFDYCDILTNVSYINHKTGKPIKYNPENTYYGKLRSGTPKIYIMPKGEAR